MTAAASTYQITCRLVDELMRRLENEVLVCELGFSSHSRRADLATIGDQLTAYEVKGPQDKPERLADQIPDYMEHFHSVYVVTIPSMIDRCRRYVPEATGLVSFEHGAFKYVRKARTRKRITRKNLADFLSLAERKIEGYSEQQVIGLIRNKHAERFSVFHEYYNGHTTEDELALLTSRSQYSLQL